MLVPDVPHHVARLLVDLPTEQTGVVKLARSKEEALQQRRPPSFRRRSQRKPVASPELVDVPVPRRAGPRRGHNFDTSLAFGRNLLPVDDVGDQFGHRLDFGLGLVQD